MTFITTIKNINDIIILTGLNSEIAFDEMDLIDYLYLVEILSTCDVKEFEFVWPSIHTYSNPNIYIRLLNNLIDYKRYDILLYLREEFEDNKISPKVTKSCFDITSFNIDECDILKKMENCCVKMMVHILHIITHQDADELATIMFANKTRTKHILKYLEEVKDFDAIDLLQSLVDVRQSYIISKLFKYKCYTLIEYVYDNHKYQKYSTKIKKHCEGKKIVNITNKVLTLSPIKLPSLIINEIVGQTEQITLSLYDRLDIIRPLVELTGTMHVNEFERFKDF